MSVFSYRFLAAIFICLSLSCSLWAQEVERGTDELVLPEVIVTATSTEKSEFEVPYQVDVIGNDEMSMGRMSRTLPDALRQTPGVSVQKSGYGQASPYIRGLTGFRTLFLIDGIRMNNSTYRVGPNQYLNLVDPFSLDRVEVVKGPGSVLYGSDAAGGTINMITLDRPLIGPAGPDLRMIYRYAEAERSHVGRLRTGGSINNKLSMHVGGTFRSFGDYEAGPDIGHNAEAGYDEWSFDTKLTWNVTPNDQVVLYYQRLQHDDAQRIHPTIFGQSWKGTQVGDERQRDHDHMRELIYLQYHSCHETPLADQMTLSLSYHTMEEERDRVKGDYSSDLQGVDVVTRGAFVKLTRNFSTGNFIYGAEYYIDEVDSFNKKYNPDGSYQGKAIQGPVGDNATYEIVGAYAQSDIWLSDRLELYLGARYTLTRAEARKTEDPLTGNEVEVDGDWEAWVGNARLVYYLDAEKTINFYVGAAQAFRAPNLSDLTSLDVADYPNEIEGPAPDLDPEKYLTYDVGFKVSNDRFMGQLGYFYTEIDDMIERNATGVMIGPDSLVTKNNVGDGFLEGVEAEGSFRVTDNFTAFGAFAWIYGRVDVFPDPTPKKKNEYKDRLPPTTGLVGLRWDSSDRRYWAEAEGIFADKADHLSTRNRADLERIPPGGTPSYEVYNLRAGADLGNGVRISAALENILDEDYRIHGSGQNEPGRNFIISAEYSNLP